MANDVWGLRHFHGAQNEQDARNWCAKPCACGAHATMPAWTRRVTADWRLFRYRGACVSEAVKNSPAKAKLTLLEVTG